jgi:hypothetical protein
MEFLPSTFYGEVSELVDEHDLGSCAERRPGSSPGFPTISTRLKMRVAQKHLGDLFCVLPDFMTLVCLIGFTVQTN